MTGVQTCALPISIEDGLVSVNGETAYQRGKKLVDGDVVAYQGQTIKIIK